MLNENSAVSIVSVVAVKIFFQIHTISVSKGKLDSACLFEFVFFTD